MISITKGENPLFYFSQNKSIMIAENKQKNKFADFLLVMLCFVISLLNVAVFRAKATEMHEITPELIFQFMNQSRSESGVSMLLLDEKLAFASESKAEDMFKNQYFNHKSPSGKTPWDFIKSAGYNYSFAGENLAMNFATAEGVQKAFMDSESHRKNILNEKFSQVGIAVKKGIMDGEATTLVVVEFGTPLRKIESVVMEKQELVKNEDLLILPKHQPFFYYYVSENNKSKEIEETIIVIGGASAKNYGFMNMYAGILTFYKAFEEEIMLILASYAISSNVLYVYEKKKIKEGLQK